MKRAPVVLKQDHQDLIYVGTDVQCNQIDTCSSCYSCYWVYVYITVGVEWCTI